VLTLVLFLRDMLLPGLLHFEVLQVMPMSIFSTIFVAEDAANMQEVSWLIVT